MSYESVERAKKEAGLEAERRIAQSLKDAFKSQKVKVYSRLDNNDSPTAISKRENHTLVTIGEQEVLKIQRGQDFVFVLQEDRLCAFIQALAVPTRQK